MPIRLATTAWMLLLLTAGLSAQEIPDAPAVPQRDYLDVWPTFYVVPWSFKTPPLNENTAKAYREQGINAVHVDKLITAASADWIDTNKFRFYVDHAAGKGTLYLRDQKPLIGRHPATQYDAGNGLVRRPKCLHDPAVLAEMEDIVRKNVAAAAKHDVICYSLDDEISTGSFDNAVETCWCPHCQPAFRKFVLGLYGGSLEKLNAEWGTTFKTADEIAPANAGDSCRQAATLTVDKWNFSRWADFRQFMDQTLADTLVRLTKLSNQIDPKHPVGFEGGQQPAAYGGYDWSRLSRSVQWVEAYDIGDNNEIIRSLAPQVVRIKTFFSTKDKVQDSNRLWYHFVHGDRGVLLWPAFKDEPWWNEKAEIAKEVAHLPAIFREQTGERLGKLLAGAEFVDDGIAIYFSQPSIRAAWIMDASVHGETWPAHSGGIERYCSSSILGRYAWTAMLEDAGLQYNFIDPAKVAAGELKFPRYKVLILPAVHAMSDSEAAAIKKFAESGGTVIADYLPGIMDEHCKTRGAKGALDDLFAVRQHDWSKGLFDGKHPTFIDGEKYKLRLSDRVFWGVPRFENWLVAEPGVMGQSTFADDPPPPWALYLGQVTGRGRAILMNLVAVPYLLSRYQDSPEPNPGVMMHFESVGFKPAVTVKTAGEFNEVLRWRKGGRMYVCVVKNLQANLKDWDNLANRAKISDKPADIEVWVAGQRPAELINERTGKKVETAWTGEREPQLPGQSWTFKDTWVPCEAAIYSYPAEKR